MSAFGGGLQHAMNAAGYALLVINVAGVHIAGADRHGCYLIDSERADDGGSTTQAILNGHMVLFGDLQHQQRWPTVLEHATAHSWEVVAAWPLPLPDAQGALAVIFDYPLEQLSGNVLAGPALADLAASIRITGQEATELHASVDHLRGALFSRVVIKQAKGILSARLNLTIDEAFARLRLHASSNGSLIHNVAADIVDGRILDL